MLILTRKLGESINIGDNIKVTVLGIYGRQVRLGIDAPLKVVVHREEVYVKIQNENRKAAQAGKKDLMSVVSMLKDKFKGEIKDDERKSNLEYRKSKRKENRNKDNDEDEARRDKNR